MKPHDVLTQAGKLIGERGHDYGGIEDNFANIANIFMAMTGKEFSPFDVAMVMISVKIARIRQSPYKDDNYLDAINYLAFAHELRPTRNGNAVQSPDPEFDALRRFARAGSA